MWSKIIVAVRVIDRTRAIDGIFDFKVSVAELIDFGTDSFSFSYLVFEFQFSEMNSSNLATGVGMIAVSAVMVVRVVDYSPMACQPRIWVIVGTHCQSIQRHDLTPFTKFS